MDRPVDRSVDRSVDKSFHDEEIALKTQEQESKKMVIKQDVRGSSSQCAGKQEASNKPTRIKPVIELKKKEVPQRLPKEEDFENFYKKWKRFHGPELHFLDKKFLESLGEEFFELEQNAWKVLASPYLKAVYNGLESIRNIDDLLVLDQKARDRITPFISQCIAGRPDSIDQVVRILHDKVSFDTRYGRKRLSLDPRILPLWLGLSA